MNCGSDNEADRRFCAECGQPLPALCAACGTANQPSAKYCGACGTPLGGLPRPRVLRATGVGEGSTSYAEPVTEIRHVSILFADLVGFTTISESRDAEEVRDLLSGYFETCKRLIVRYGGSVEKFIGDAVMAVWGTPVSREDDAERCVRAALELTQAVAALGHEAGLANLRARAGVLSGEAAVNVGAKEQGMVAGDLVNTASRIQAAAPPGMVYVGETTRRATEAAIAYEDVGSHDLKGKSAPVPLWRAVRVIGLLGGASRQGELEPAFAGRDSELHLIKELFHAAAEERRPHLVSVIGIGGIGKTRLSWEFEKYVDGLVDVVWWHRGRCLAYGDGVAFWALAEMVRMRAGIVEDEESMSARTKLHESLETHISDAAERRFVEPRLFHLLGLEDRGSGDQENLFPAWRLYFERLSDTKPTVLVFEDIQWADSSLLEFIEYLLEWSRDHPIFILTLGRPELAERHPTWGARKRSFTSLFLDPLSNEAMAALLRAPVPGLPDELQARILERAEGVPFYAVETVRMLLDRGMIVRQGTSFHPVGAIDTLEIPETLQALIAARLDGLAPAERQLLQDAAVLGRSFTISGLVAVTGVRVAELEPLLSSLVRKEVLTVSRDPLSPERGQYGFLQDLVKKVAYDTMSRKRRRTLHIAAAEFLESGSGPDDDDVVEVIASHYFDAYRAAPDAPDAPEIKTRARDGLIRAAERASSLGASLEAQASFERAVELTDEALAQAELLERAAMMAEAGARGSQAVILFERSIALFESQAASHAAARVAARLGEVMWDKGRMKESLANMDRAFHALVNDPPDESFAWLAAQLGRFLFFVGDKDLSAQRIETALDVAEALDLPEVVSQTLNTKNLLLFSSGRHYEARALLEAALRIAIENDRPSAALRAYNNMVDLLYAEDSYEAAQANVESGLALARRVGNRYWERTFIGYCYPMYCLGRWDEALARLDELSVDDRVTSRIAFSQGYVSSGTAMLAHRGAMEQAAERVALFEEFERGSDVQERSEHACAVAVLRLAQGKPEDALRAVQRALEPMATLGVWHYAIRESLVLGINAALSMNDRETANELLGIAERLPNIRGMRFLPAHVLRFRARMAEGDGNPELIAASFEQAALWFREIRHQFSLGVTLLEHGEWLEREGQISSAAPLVVEARAIFQQLGAIAWVERLAKLSVASPAQPIAAEAETAQ
ncbi:MAG: adenylate/guanylate cyclase domain-containing protein [Candidatus Dormiibacterota bacterium]